MATTPLAGLGPPLGQPSPSTPGGSSKNARRGLLRVTTSAAGTLPEHGEPEPGGEPSEERARVTCLAADARRVGQERHPIAVGVLAGAVLATPPDDDPAAAVSSDQPGAHHPSGPDQELLGVRVRNQAGGRARRPEHAQACGHGDRARRDAVLGVAANDAHRVPRGGASGRGRGGGGGGDDQNHADKPAETRSTVVEHRH